MTPLDNICASHKDNHEIPEYVLMDATKKFYANLITPLSKLVLKNSRKSQIWDY
jgi:flavorubredoxin